jgi:hypothetical protein
VTLYNSAIPSPFCERRHDSPSDVRHETSSIARFSSGHQFRYPIAHRKIVYARMGRSRGVISSGGSTTDQRNSILGSICCDPKTCISLNSPSKYDRSAVASMFYHRLGFSIQGSEDVADAPTATNLCIIVAGSGVETRDKRSRP